MSKLEKPISFAEKCRQYNINEHNAQGYKQRHPELTDEQVIEYYLTPKKQSFQSLCEQYCIKYNTAFGYKRKHPELTDEQVIDYFLSKTKKGKTFTEKLREHNISISRGRNYKQTHKNMTDEEIIRELLKDKEKTFTEKCEEYKLNPMTVNYYRDKCNAQSDEELIQYVIELRKNKPLSFKEKCEKAGVSYNAAYKQRHIHTELTDEQVIDLVLDAKNRESFKDKCKKAGISYGSALEYRKKKSGLSDDEIILEYKTYIAERQNNLGKICRENNIDYDIVSSYLHRHTNVTVNDAIRQCKIILTQRDEYVKELESICNEIGIAYNNEKNLKELCNRLNIRRDYISSLIKKHKCTTAEAFVKALNYKAGIIPDKESFAKKCERFNIDLVRAYGYRSCHPELTDEQIIVHYRPDCYINILGEIVDPTQN